MRHLSPTIALTMVLAGGMHAGSGLAGEPLEYVPLTTSKVVGSPEPPLPFRVVRTLPNLEIDRVLQVVTQPGTRQLVVVHEDRPSKRFRLLRTKGDPATGEFEVLLETTDTAYDVCFHPDFESNGFLYVGGNGARGDGPKMTRVTRYTMRTDEPRTIDPESARVIVEWESNGHNGAAVAFGNDGMLYVTSGDGTSDSDTNLTGQGLDHLLAKVLRIDVDHPDEGRAYSVPRDNPFVGQDGVRPETWAYGFRNPWRMTVDRETGHVWVGNNGQDLWEQVYLVERGANYGWSVYEGGHPFYLQRELGPTPVSKPTLEHPHSESRSLTGGVVYRGKRFPELRGAYVYGDYSTGKIWGAKHDGKRVVWHRELADTTLQITAFALDADGELLICDYRDDGGLHTFERNDEPDFDPAEFPRRLSETGLFASVAEHAFAPGVIPYTVNSPLWSDGAHKSRAIAMPSDSGDEGGRPRIGFSPLNAWRFPDRTVLVKSFALDLEEGRPDSRRWIETRLMLLQQGEWVGYSYAWNAEQSEATLVESAGRDRTFRVRTEDGHRDQVWRYPSRAECMTCHSRAAGFVLGLSTPQLNREHDYDGHVENQLHALERLGVLKVDWKKAAEGADNDAAAGFAALADPYDETQPLEARARSYLHTNCAMCHVEAGGGNAQMVLRFRTPLDKTKLIDAVPLHDAYGVAEARLVAPGDPDRSLLLRRLATRGRGQMPQLATTRVDEPAVRMIRQWIGQLPSGE